MGETIHNRLVEDEERLGGVGEAALVCEGRCVAGGTESLSPQPVTADDEVEGLLDDLHLVLTGENIFTDNALLLSVLQGVVVFPHVEKVFLTLSAHLDGASELRGTLGEVGAALTELLQEESATVLTQRQGNEVCSDHQSNK